MPASSAHIDWLTCTLDARAGAGLPRYIWPLHNAGFDINRDDRPAQFRRYPYNHVITLNPAGRLYWDDTDNVSFASVELTGSECTDIGDAAVLKLAAESRNVSRLDIAIDIECQTMPTDFVAEGVSASFSSRQVITSDTGQTVYIGSTKSDRYLRVYRYTGSEHPRSHLLRLEFCLRNDRAWSTARAMMQSSHSDPAQSIARALCEAFELKGHDLAEFMTGDALPVIIPRKNTTSLNRFHWLMTQVRPALFELTDDEITRLLAGVPAAENWRTSGQIPF